MALQGDLKTFSFPDLLQWMEGSRKAGRLTLICGNYEWVFYLEDGMIAAFGTPGIYERIVRILRLSATLDERTAQQAVETARAGGSFEDGIRAVGADPDVAREVAREDAFQAAADLFEDHTGAFHYSDDIEFEGEERVQVGIGLRELVYESARRIDEAAAAVEAIPNDALSVRSGKPATSGASTHARAALAVLGEGTTVGGVRLALGLSRAGAALLLQEMRRQGWLHVEGAQALKSDPLTQMLRQGERLLADGHFDAATLMCTSLLSTDPSDRRVRDFARAVEREHVETLYRKLLPVAVLQIANPSSLEALRPDERIVAKLVNGRWDVSTLVLASPLRELQTLRAIERMVELGYAELG